MLKNNQKVKGIIKQVESDGSGVLLVGKDKVLVRNVLINEEVEVQIEKRLKDAYVGKVIRMIRLDANRVNVECKYYEKCGSCHLMHVNYAKQLEMKQQLVIDMVRKQGLRDMKVMKCEGMQDPYAYRNKIIISFGRDNNQVAAGFYGEHSHNIIPISHCALHETKVNELIENVKKVASKTRIQVYEEDKKRGFLRHILIRRAVATNQTMLVIVGAEKIFKAKNNFVTEIRKLHPEIDTIVFNYNPRKTSVVLGNDETVVYGRGYIEDELCGYRFKISPKSFYQINHTQCESLYTKAISLLSLKGNEVLIDAYSGIGTIGMIASKQVKHVYSVELNKDAVKDAMNNARINQIKNITFKCEDAGKFMEEMAAQKKRVDAVIMDPARDGSDEAFLSSVVKLSPKQVVYISCNPLTQIRDIEYLQKNGYQTKELYPFDMFPQTFHVESIVLLTKD